MDRTHRGPGKFRRLASTVPGVIRFVLSGVPPLLRRGFRIVLAVNRSARRVWRRALCGPTPIRAQNAGSLPACKSAGEATESLVIPIKDAGGHIPELILHCCRDAQEAHVEAVLASLPESGAWISSSEQSARGGPRQRRSARRASSLGLEAIAVAITSSGCRVCGARIRGVATRRLADGDRAIEELYWNVLRLVDDPTALVVLTAR
jgi:hypothetical protein